MALSFFDRWFHRLRATGSSPVAPAELSATTDAEAQFRLAQCFCDGHASDEMQAMQWYSKAAEQGHCEAQFHLAQMHAQGKGGVRNEPAALLWLRRAAEGGHAGAQYHLGVRLYRASKSKIGSEASKLRIEALRWLHKSVAQAWHGAESAREFVLLGMTKQEAAEGEPRAQPSIAKPAASTTASPGSRTFVSPV